MCSFIPEETMSRDPTKGVQNLDMMLTVYITVSIMPRTNFIFLNKNNQNSFDPTLSTILHTGDNFENRVSNTILRNLNRINKSLRNDSFKNSENFKNTHTSKQKYQI